MAAVAAAIGLASGFMLKLLRADSAAYRANQHTSERDDPYAFLISLCIAGLTVAAVLTVFALLSLAKALLRRMRAGMAQ